MKSQISNPCLAGRLVKSQKAVSEFSAGGVVYQALGLRPELKPRGTRHQQPVLWLICKHSGYHKWVLPKGIVEQGESPEETAVREVREETGITVRIIKRIEPGVRYTYKKGDVLVRKRVTFYLMEYVSGDIADRSWEMEDSRWVLVDEAIKKLAFLTERRTLQRASKMIA